MYNYSDNYIDPNFYQSILGNNPDTKNRLCAGLTYEGATKLNTCLKSGTNRAFLLLNLKLQHFCLLLSIKYFSVGRASDYEA